MRRLTFFCCSKKSRSRSLREVTKFAFAAGPRRIVGAEDHGDGRFVDAQRRQRLGIFPVGDGVADADVLDAGDGDDVAGFGGRDFDCASTPASRRLG